MKEGYVAYADASVYSQRIISNEYEDKWGYVNECIEIGKLCYVYALVHFQRMEWHLLMITR